MVYVVVFGSFNDLWTLIKSNSSMSLIHSTERYKAWNIFFFASAKSLFEIVLPLWTRTGRLFSRSEWSRFVTVDVTLFNPKMLKVQFLKTTQNVLQLLQIHDEKE